MDTTKRTIEDGNKTTPELKIRENIKRNMRLNNHRNVPQHKCRNGKKAEEFRKRCDTDPYQPQG